MAGQQDGERRRLDKDGEGEGEELQAVWRVGTDGESVGPVFFYCFLFFT